MRRIFVVCADDSGGVNATRMTKQAARQASERFFLMVMLTDLLRGRSDHRSGTPSIPCTTPASPKWFHECAGARCANAQPGVTFGETYKSSTHFAATGLMLPSS
jgi:hypothetical protein